MQEHLELIAARTTYCTVVLCMYCTLSVVEESAGRSSRRERWVRYPVRRGVA